MKFFRRGDNHDYDELQDQQRSYQLPAGLLYLALALALMFALLISSIPLTLDQQLLFVLASLGLSLLLRPRSELSRFRVIVLMLISVIATGRYIFWRLSESLGWFNSNLDLSYLDYFFSSGLLLAEIYAWSVLFLGYFQTIWPLRRPIFPLPKDESLWPSVDVFIPTYNEPLKVVAPTLVAAQNIDWPKEKLNVYILDDGCREEFREFAKEAGINYIARESSEGAKAGNINYGLERTYSDFIAIFDSDHVPVCSFLKKTMGWFLQDSRMGIVQTPHLFFTPDPVERNLQIFHRVPPEGQLFYGLVQDGNDTWNASFFCGSCAVLSRQALDDIGGIATETVTEDAHTSLLIQKAGYNTAYINTPLAAGLATERLSHHIAQRMRWARGMIQIFRTDNPLLAKGLKLGQRLCYFNAMLHFLFGLPRIVFLTAPLAYLFFEAYVIQASAALIAVYALPHIFQAQVANSVMQGRFRHSFWADVYETLISAHLIGPTVSALFNPGKGKFNVTDKGGVVKEDHFDWSSSKIVFLLLLLNLIGLVIAVLRLFWLNADETGTVLINFCWTIYNSIILGAALSVAWEKRQRRDNPRINRVFRAFLHLPDGRRVRAETSDISIRDVSLKIPPGTLVNNDDRVEVELIDEHNQGYRFSGSPVTILSRHLGIKFDEMTPQKMGELVYFTHSHDNAWDEWYKVWRPSKPFASFFEIVRFGVLGVIRALGGGHSDDPENRVRSDYGLAVWLFAIALIILGSTLLPQSVRAAEIESIQQLQEIELPLTQLGINKPIRLRGGDSQDDVWFSLRADQVPQQAELQLHFSLAKQLIREYKSLDITLNNQSLGSIAITEDNVERRLMQVLPIDPLYISDLNQLAFRLTPIAPEFCEKLNFRAITAEISEFSKIHMQVAPLELVNDLALFPIPFFDQFDDGRLELPIVMNSTALQSISTLKAAGILTSWFGAKAHFRGADFPVFTNNLPDRHALIFTTPDMPVQGIDVRYNEPSAHIMSHPDSDKAHIKFLVISAPDSHGLITAARSIASGQVQMSGSSIQFHTSPVIATREPYDAPRWLKDNDKTYLSELNAPSGLSSTGISPKQISLDFRIAPDLFAWKRSDLPIKVDYFYSDLPLKDTSSMDVNLSGSWIKSVSLETGNNLASRFERAVKEGREPPAPSLVHASDYTYLKNYQLAGINNLSFYFDLQLPNDAAQTCASLYADNMHVGIGPGSHIDLTGWSHFTRMPDLAKFSNMGFPFTRIADLSETAVLLPNSPEKGELQMMFNALGLLGAASGYPAFNVSIFFPHDAELAYNKDILLIGTPERQPLLQLWRDKLPIVQQNDKSWGIRKLSLLEKATLWWKGERSERNDELTRSLHDIGKNFIGITSFQSPMTDQRTVVALLANEPSQLKKLGQALNDPNTLREFQGDTTLLTSSGPENFRLLPSYHVGNLPFLTKMRWYLANHILALLSLFTLVVMCAALVMRILMQQRAESRFDTTDDNH